MVCDPEKDPQPNDKHILDGTVLLNHNKIRNLGVRQVSLNFHRLSAIQLKPNLGGCRMTRWMGPKLSNYYGMYDPSKGPHPNDKPILDGTFFDKIREIPFNITLLLFLQTLH